VGGRFVLRNAYCVMAWHCTCYAVRIT